MARFETNPNARSLVVGNAEVGCITDIPQAREAEFVNFLRNSKTTFIGITGLPYFNITQAAPPKSPPAEFARLWAKPLGGPTLPQDWLDKVTQHEALFLSGAAPK